MPENSKPRVHPSFARILDPISAPDLRRRSVSLAREIAIIVVFCFFTALMTWPWVLHLRDAVADRGDPYMIAWTLWWDYHQTFHNPLHLFDANVFYPYKYTLAFSENDYGIAILFFPLFAAGLKPLTVNSIATFLGFAFCGYGAFRLTRTLTGRSGAAWIAGIVFAFIPFRFDLLSHLHYLFAGWIPLMLESLVLFARGPTWRRATWLGVAFFMNGLSCISWLIMTIVPLALTFIFLVSIQKSLWRNREFWRRGTIALALASLALFPFLWPYYKVTVLYGLRWQPWEFALSSPSAINWFKAEPRNRIWQNFGLNIPGHMLFPGMLAPLLTIASLRFRDRLDGRSRIEQIALKLLDFVIVTAAIVAAFSIGYGDNVYKIFGHRVFRLTDRSTYQALAIVIFALGLKASLLSPSIMSRLRHGYSRQFAAIELKQLPDSTAAIGVGVIWTVAGFLSSLGANFFVNRWLHDHVILFQSIRIPARAAMICYLGLAVLAGIGASRLAVRAREFFSCRPVEVNVLVLIAMALLFELHASPLRFESGEVNPTALALRLRQTPMRGGLVELPSAENDVSRHFYMLRAADHGKPLVNATSSFITPLTDQINKATAGRIAPTFMDILEKIPASYLVIHNDRLLTAWQTEYEIFLTGSLTSGRLRFINRFDDGNDLYAVVKTEPEARGEAPLPFSLATHELSALIRQNPVNLLSCPKTLQTLYRIYFETNGALPRYADFMRDANAVSRGVILESEDGDQVLNANLRKLLDEWVRRDAFVNSFGQLDDAQFIDKLSANAGINMDNATRAKLVDDLANHRETRADALLKIAQDQSFVDKENERSLLLLHYFGYLRRNPDDPPDRNLNGFNFWLQELEKHHDTWKIATAFQNSIEFQSIKER